MLRKVYAIWARGLKKVRQPRRPTRPKQYKEYLSSVHPTTGHKGPGGRGGAYKCSPTVSLISALDGMEGQRHAPTTLPPWKTRYPLYRRLGGPQGRSGRVRKISPPPGFDPWTIQPTASRYTDWAIPTHICLRRHHIINLPGAPTGLGSALPGNSQTGSHNYQPLRLNMPVTGYLFSVRWFGAAGD